MTQNNANKDGNDTKARKKRVTKDAPTLLKEAIESVQKARLAQAKIALESVPEYCNIKDSSELVQKYITEANVQTDDEKQKERIKAMNDRIERMKRKAEVARSYIAKRAKALTAFNDAKTEIGKLQLEKMGSISLTNLDSHENDLTPDEVREILLKHLSSDDLKILADGTDPFAEFRREKNEADLSKEDTNLSPITTETI